MFFFCFPHNDFGWDLTILYLHFHYFFFFFEKKKKFKNLSNDDFVLSPLEEMLIHAEQRVVLKFGSKEENCICESLRFYSQKEQIYMIQYMKNIETRNLATELEIEEKFGILQFQVEYCFEFLMVITV